ncbi:lycopene beta-cyclase CrtY [Parerythrobacter jejuensis]|uniref:Lycopene beta-cyclase CrtY n=1 Tax=Parerythrobacter jejuensis TaxID=795812 RepID=A0A845AJC2_9SPHN|nr:lycopene beta-cyclase CrtY [Parerythrobacter jejuensis]MXP30360.1 lycopene beta-cyclase CrtY [Parerythrobacter jejuensis]MXP33120.1 lycopene beta-cyclase CrtY [Parerythrobacter jejuensis]
MNGRRADVAIVGGGLSGGLIALALRKLRPELDVILLEAGERLGGNHRWSWFGSDVSEAGANLLAPFRKAEWLGYDVAFPRLRRTLSSRYFSLASPDYDAGLRRELAQDTIHTKMAVAQCSNNSVTLASGDTVQARTVIDCRGFEPSPHMQGGWQIFMGRHMRTKTPHLVERPVIMDASVEQHDGFRFVYVLPLGANDIFIEDTYYNDSPTLDRGALSSRLDRYCNEQGWDGDILGSETGVLPVITSGQFGKYRQERQLDQVAQAGARALLAHPLTSYTMPQAVETALLVAENADLPGDQMAAIVANHAAHHWKRTGYYRLLGTMLFGAAEPTERYRVFERFYGLNEGLVERFYAARSSFADKARILSGKPPVAIHRAIGAIASQRNPLVRNND